MGYIVDGTVRYLAMLPFLVIFQLAVVILKYRRKEVPIRWQHILGIHLFCYLLITILSITGAGGILDIGRYGKSIIRMDEINLIPLVHWSSGDILGLVLNAIMFMPCGFLLPFIWKSFTKVKYAVLWGAVFSFMIEVSQLFNYRATDIDDLLMNTLGCLLGYLVFLGMRPLLRKLGWGKHTEGTDVWSKEGAAYTAFVFGYRFFLSPFVMSVVYKVLYGF